MPESIREALERPFDEEMIKQRKGRKGTVEYIEIGQIILRLNEVFDATWNFEIMEHFTEGHEVVVLGKLTANGVSKMQFGGKKITTGKESGEIVSISDDLKAAASDSLKKCAGYFGIGLDLYMDGEPQQSSNPPRTTDKQPPENPAKTENQSNIGELRNSILKAEKEASAAVGKTATELRQEYLETKTLGVPMDKLNAYMQQLTKMKQPPA